MPDIIQQRALKTWHTSETPQARQRDNAILGLVGEAGELAELHKKDVFKPNHESDIADRLDELGDVLYYVAILAHLADGHGWQPDYVKDAD